MRRFALVSAAGILVLLMLLPLASRQDADLSDGLRYIALGDSIPSGNAFPTDENRPCQRSTDSYAWMVGQQLAGDFEPDEFTFIHIACSGARSAASEDVVIERCFDTLEPEVTDEQRDECALKWLPNQVDEALDLLDGRRALVTITIGANDTGWTDPLGLIALMLATDEEFGDAIDEVAADVESALADEIERLVSEPFVTVVVTDIYNPFNQESAIFRLALAGQARIWGPENVGDDPCTGTDRDGVVHLLSCSERAEYGLQSLSAAIQRAAAHFPDRVLAVSLIDAFRGHEAPEGSCGDAVPSSGETWIRDIASGGLVPLPDCFHPNTAGAQAIAEIVLDVWRAQREP